MRQSIVKIPKVLAPQLGIITFILYCENIIADALVCNFCYSW